MPHEYNNRQSAQLFESVVIVNNNFYKGLFILV